MFIFRYWVYVNTFKYIIYLYYNDLIYTFLGAAQVCIVTICCCCFSADKNAIMRILQNTFQKQKIYNKNNKQ